MGFLARDRLSSHGLAVGVVVRNGRLVVYRLVPDFEGVPFWVEMFWEIPLFLVCGGCVVVAAFGTTEGVFAVVFGVGIVVVVVFVPRGSVEKLPWGGGILVALE